jgi:hypothetical protein
MANANGSPDSLAASATPDILSVEASEAADASSVKTSGTAFLTAIAQRRRAVKGVRKVRERAIAEQPSRLNMLTTSNFGKQSGPP